MPALIAAETEADQEDAQDAGGTQNPEPGTSVNASDLSEALVTRIFQRLDASGITGGGGTQQKQRESAFQSKVSELLKSDQIDKDSFGLLVQLMEGLKADMSAEQQQNAQQIAIEVQTKVTHQRVFDLIDRFGGKGNAIAQKAKSAIANEIINEFNTDMGRVNRYMNQDVDWAAFERIAAKTMNNWFPQGKAQGSPTVTAGGDRTTGITGKSNATTSAAGASTKGVDDLNEKQREVYNAQQNFFKKHAAGVKEEDRHSKSMAAALRFKGK